MTSPNRLALSRFRILQALLCLWMAPFLGATSILFVGNSFTFYPQAVTEPGGLTGVPAILTRLMAQDDRPDAVVSMRVEGGKSLAWHLERNRPALGKPYDIVVLQDLSTGPLGDAGRATFSATVAEISGLLRARNPSVKIYLYETWARPDLILQRRYPDLWKMQDLLREAYRDTAGANKLAGWVPVGDAFVRGVEWNLADDPATKEEEGPLSLWGNDKYHQSAAGAYLSAILFYHYLLQAEIKAIPAGAGSAAASLGLTRAEAAQLHQIAGRVIAETSPASNPVRRPSRHPKK